MFCKHCGKEIDDLAVICIHCGNAVNSAPVAPQKEDKISVGLVILAVLFPIFGFIYWPVKHSDAPRRARACGIAAIISFVVSIVLNIIVIIATPLFFDLMSGLLYDWYI